MFLVVLLMLDFWTRWCFHWTTAHSWYVSWVDAISISEYHIHDISVVFFLLRWIYNVWKYFLSLFQLMPLHEQMAISTHCGFLSSDYPVCGFLIQCYSITWLFLFSLCIKFVTKQKTEMKNSYIQRMFNKDQVTIIYLHCIYFPSLLVSPWNI